MPRTRIPLIPAPPGDNAEGIDPFRPRHGEREKVSIEAVIHGVCRLKANNTFKHPELVDGILRRVLLLEPDRIARAAALGRDGILNEYLTMTPAEHAERMLSR